MMDPAASPEPHILSELYGSLEQIAGLGTWRYVFETRRLTWSAGIYDLLGIPRWSEAPSHDLFGHFVFPADRIDIENMSLYLEKVRSIDREFRIARPDGRMTWLAHKAEVFSNERGECAFAVGILLDITKLKEALIARDYAEDRLRTVTSVARSFTWTVDANGKKPPSQAWTNLTGQTAEQSSHLGWLDAIYEEDREETKKAWLEAEKNRSIYSAKYRLRCADGELRWFVARCAPIFDESNNLIEWFGVAIDISDVKKPSDPFHRAMEMTQIDGAMFRAARAMLNWSVETFSSKSGLSISSVRRLEGEANTSARAATAMKALSCLNKSGIEFCRLDDEGCYVRLRDKTPKNA